VGVDTPSHKGPAGAAGIVVVVAGAYVVNVTVPAAGATEIHEQALERRDVRGGAVVRVHWLEIWVGMTGFGAIVVVGPVGRIVEEPETVTVGVIVT